MATQRSNLFHRGHYNKIAALLGRVGAKHNLLDPDEEVMNDGMVVWDSIIQAFGDMFVEDYPKREGDDTYYFQRERFNDAIARHYAETIRSGS